MRIRTSGDLSALARGRRMEHGWTQADVAARAGVSRKWVSDFETGKASVDLSAVLRLLDALAVELSSADDATAGGPPRPNATDLDAHLQRYRTS